MWKAVTGLPNERSPMLHVVLRRDRDWGEMIPSWSNALAPLQMFPRSLLVIPQVYVAQAATDLNRTEPCARPRLLKDARVWWCGDMRGSESRV